MDIFLLRHGQSEYNIGLTDFLDSKLTPAGRQQALLTAERFKRERLTKAFVSPLRRTLETMAPISAATGVKAEVEANLCEFFSSDIYREFPGLSFDDISREFPFTFFGNTFPGVTNWWPQAPENDAAIYGRALALRDALISKYADTDETILILSHSDTVGRVIEAFLRIPPNPIEPPFSDNCGISHLTCSTDPTQPATLDYMNDTAHLHV